MSKFVTDPPPVFTIPVSGGGQFPVRRIFCIGRNYLEHVREMGSDVSRSAPVFFMKPAESIAPPGAGIPYPPETDDLHFEGELVVALKSGGKNINESGAGDTIYGFAAGCDLTRRDLQARAKKSGAPWEAAKAFDHSAPVGPITPLGEEGFTSLEHARLRTFVNGEERQNARLSEMIWSVREIIAHLSKFSELKSGDIIFTGTPAGVGSLSRGDKVEVIIDELAPLKFSIKR